MASPAYEADIGTHVFPTFKYRQAREHLEASGVPSEAFVLPTIGERSSLALIHTQQYLQEFFGLRRTQAVMSSELPLTQEIVDWFELACYGSAHTARLALGRGGAMHLGGGFHHAFANRAEGFCYLNDIAVAARLALGDDDGVPLETPTGEPVTRISVVDLDVHQGNGTARIFQGDPRVFTFSMHQENNYPVKERGDLDYGLPDGMPDQPYLELLEKGLQIAVGERQPHLVLYVAGADPYRDDVLGGLSLTMDGLRARDRAVFRAAHQVGASVAVVLAGGYAARREDTARIHFHTAQELLAVWPHKQA